MNFILARPGSRPWPGPGPALAWPWPGPGPVLARPWPGPDPGPGPGPGPGEGGGKMVTSGWWAPEAPGAGPGELNATPSATAHLRNNHMCGGVNIGVFIKYYIGAFIIQLTEYNHNL